MIIILLVKPVSTEKYGAANIIEIFLLLISKVHTIKLSKIKKIKLNRLIWAYKKANFIKSLCEKHKITDTNAVLIEMME